MLPNRFTEPDFPRQASDVKWRKTTEREGEMEREIELGEERRCERDDGDTGKTMKHKGKHEPKGNRFIIKQLLLFVAYRFRFIGMKDGTFPSRSCFAAVDFFDSV